MLHLETRHDFVHITCDCGRLSITLENRGRMPDRPIRCGHCGEQATTGELLAREADAPQAPQPQTAAKPNLLFRIGMGLLGIGPKRRAGAA